MVVSVLILEEALSIESLSDDQGLESLLESIDETHVGLARISLAIEGDGSGIVELDINRLLKSLLGEHLINTVAEFLPEDVWALLW